MIGGSTKKGDFTIEKQAEQQLGQTYMISTLRKERVTQEDAGVYECRSKCKHIWLCGRWPCIKMVFNMAGLGS